MSETEQIINDAYIRVVEIIIGYEYTDDVSKMGALKAVIDACDEDIREV